MSDPPSSARHGLANVVILAFLVMQIGLPLSYYVGSDRFDERFSWRMFSPIRMARCSVTLYDATPGTEHKIALSRQLHVVWINLLKRARLTVLDGFAEKWCAEGEGRVLRADLTCVPPEAARHPICKRVADRDGDGVPDGFDQHEACAGLDAKACFAEKCGELAPSACYEAHCSVRVVPRDLDLCGGDA